MIMDKISLALVIIGALNWGGIGLFRFDTVAWICGGQGSIVARIIYTLVALAGIWCISLLFREEDPAPAPAGPAAPPPWRPSAAHSRPPQRTACPAGAVTAPLLAPARPTPPSPKAILLWGAFAGAAVLPDGGVAFTGHRPALILSAPQYPARS